MHLRSPVLSAPVRLAPMVTLVGLSLAACTSTAPSASPTPASTPLVTPSVEATPMDTPSDPATASPSVAATAPAEPTALEVNWTVSFVMTAPPDWTTEVLDYMGTTTANTLWLTAGQRFLAVTRSGPDTVQGWLDTLAGAEQLVATEPSEVVIGGSPGYRMDLDVSDQASEARCLNPGRCYMLFQDDSGFWPVEEGRTTAVWFVEVGDETLAIATDARANSFAEWGATVEEVLATIEWR